MIMPLLKFLAFLVVLSAYVSRQGDHVLMKWFSTVSAVEFHHCMWYVEWCLKGLAVDYAVLAVAFGFWRAQTLAVLAGLALYADAVYVFYTGVLAGLVKAESAVLRAYHALI